MLPGAMGSSVSGRRGCASYLFLAVALVLLVVASGVAGGAAAWLWWREPATPVRAVTPRGDLSGTERTTVEIFGRVSPSVVHITNLQVRRSAMHRDVMAIPQGSGSGFLWDRAGHVITNYHVLQQADAARVTLGDGTTWNARLVGHHADKDLAVLRIDAPADKLTPIPVGSSRDLSVGQSVFAIGNPFGLDHTLSTGVISGLGREIMSVSRRPIQGVIQTDAAINPGNSGGPLLDSAGRLIGINTAIYSPSGASAGVGFAVPVDTVAQIIPQLIQFGRVTRPGLGIQIDEEGQIARVYGIRGVLVMGVVPESGAARAGLQPGHWDQATGSFVLGDVIVEVDGQPIEAQVDLFRLLDRKQVGQTVRVKVVRQKAPVEVDIALVALQD